MSYLSDPMGAALDRHITGNYGEDQLRGYDEWLEMRESACADCFMTLLCQCDGEHEPCLIIDAYIKRHEEDMKAYEEQMYEDWCEEQALERLEAGLDWL